jgi:hypothetical protein
MRYVVVTFYDWKEPLDYATMTRFGIDRTFIQRYAITAIADYLNAVADKGWEPVTTTFVPGYAGQDDPRRAADKLVVILRNPSPKE